MKKKIPLFLWIAAALLFVGFGIGVAADYQYYITEGIYGSAPFDLYILIRAIEFLLPAILCFIVGLVLRRKYSHSSGE